MKPFFSLIDDDVQTVALEEIGRELSKAELKRVKEDCVENINWYEAIANTLDEHIDDGLIVAS